MQQKTPVPPGDDIVLVDEHDRPIGTTTKLAAHQNGGRLHRAFSVFLFNSRDELLLQKRAMGKYHFGGLWSNACCSHPKPMQKVEEAARARLQFELGIDVPIAHAFTFIYRAEDPLSKLVEHELDHIFTGRFDGSPAPNPEEVEQWAWIDSPTLLRDMSASPGRYTPWFKIILQRVLEHRTSRQV